MDWINENLATLASLGIGLYEIIARKKPTEKDISILSNVMKVISVVLPNKKKAGGTH